MWHRELDTYHRINKTDIRDNSIVHRECDIECRVNNTDNSDSNIEYPELNMHNLI